METGTESTATSAQEATEVNDATETDGIDWKSKAREWERRAKDNKSAADELAALKDSKKSVEQKLAELESKHAEAEARALRSDIAAKYGISAEHRDKFLTGSTPEALEDQAKTLAELADANKKTGNRAPKEGRPVNTNLSPKDAAKREWLQSLSGD